MKIFCVCSKKKKEERENDSAEIEANRREC